MKILFHCCCAPCATACVESLAGEGIETVLFWYNANIHLYTEYKNRRDALIAFASAKNLPLEMLDEYGLSCFLQSIGSETEAPGRCEICYRLRLEKTAIRAAEGGFDAFSTSLLISPYQRHDAIRRIGGELASRYGVAFLYRDFRPLFREGQAKARSLGLYMQKYCGCIFSDAPKKGRLQTAPFQKENNGVVPKPQFQNNFLDKTSGGEGGADVKTPLLFQRLALLAGEEVMEKLARTTALVFGAGGVGSWCAEALVRSGVGGIGIVDYDTVCASNVNRQVQATSRTIGRIKAEALKERLLEINPRCKVTAYGKAFSGENAGEFGIEEACYVIDAIDSLPQKLDLIEACHAAGTTFFSSMGMARKMDPTRIKTAGIWETRGCPLARLVRQGLRRRGFAGSFIAVYSDEPPWRNDETAAGEQEPSGGGKAVNGSAVTVTASAGMVLASLVLRGITGEK